ncbi:MAG: hypothetical protein R2778_08665 [Saprospiraceae bacterium]
MAAVAENYKQSRIHPHKLALWIAIASIIMMFGGSTSAYAVCRAAGNWLEFKLPFIFFINTAVILLSSLLAFVIYWVQARKERQYKGLLLLTFFLGLYSWYCGTRVGRADCYWGNFHG